jgi:hypothetical protein
MRFSDTSTSSWGATGHSPSAGIHSPWCWIRWFLACQEWPYPCALPALHALSALHGSHDVGQTWKVVGWRRIMVDLRRSTCPSRLPRAQCHRRSPVYASHVQFTSMWGAASSISHECGRSTTRLVRILSTRRLIGGGSQLGASTGTLYRRSAALLPVDYIL